MRLVLRSTAALGVALSALSIPSFGKTRKTRPPALTGVAAERATVRRWMSTLTLSDKAAQLIVMPCYAEPINLRAKSYRDYQHQVRDLHIGGLIMLGRVVQGSVQPADPAVIATFFNRMQKLSKLPLLVGADFERGTSLRVKDATPWPNNMAFGAANDIDGVRYQAAATARAARILGIHWIFAPVADVNSNPDNPIINTRSYGENPAKVGDFVRAYIEGAHSNPKYPVLVTAKHFPGHGNTSEDSHLGLARNPETIEQLRQTDLAPFRDAVRAGVDAIMTAHMAVPAVEEREIPATVSRAVLTGLLRDELKFPGLVVTDAMDMQGLSKLFDVREASVRAVEAGADVLLMPKNAGEAILGLVSAVQSGRISKARLDASVERILTAKVKLGLPRRREVSTSDLEGAFNPPQDAARAQQTADRAVALLRNEKKLLPIAPSETACLTVLAENRSGSEGPHLIEEFKTRAPKMRMQILDALMPPDEINRALEGMSQCSANIIAAYVTNTTARGITPLAGDFPRLLTTLLEGKTPVILLGLGSPYALRAFPQAETVLATFSTSDASETAVVKSLFGEISILGKLPVTLPGFAAYGDGLALAAKTNLGASK